MKDWISNVTQKHICVNVNLDFLWIVKLVSKVFTIWILRLQIGHCELDFLSLLFFTECEQPTDCPNNGLNYECNGNLCECSDGFALNGETCDSLGGILCS